MSELTTDHYRMLLGFDEDWSVDAVTFDPSGKRVVINISFAGSKRMCASHSRFTLLFEVFAIEVLCACANVSPAAGLLGLSWAAMHSTIERAVERGLDRRSLDNIEHVGVDEKSFGKGHSYVSVMTDIDHRRVLEVVAERTIEATDKLWETLTDTQKSEVKSVSMDMWQAFMTSASKNVPDAEIVHDKFHIAKYLAEAVDKVRHAENKSLNADGDQTLKGTRQMWLYNMENLDEDRWKLLRMINDDDYAWKQVE